MEAFAQILSIAGLACVVGSYQQKKKSALLAVQATGGALFGVHYLLLGAYAGFLLNIIAVTRALVFYKEDLPKQVGNIWVWIFHGLCLVAYILTFTVFDTEPSVKNLFLEILPAIGMVCLSISFNMTGAKEIRRLGTVSSVCWLIYNFAHLSIGGIACEAMCLVSIIVGILRHDRKEK